MQSNEKYSQAYLRWTVNERTQHWILAISFIVLVFTGFALKYPESWWSWPFLYAGAFDLRGTLHRIAGSAYLALSFYHVWYLLFNERGRAKLQALKLRLQDIFDMKDQILHNLGKSRTVPKYGHFTYWEKFEYWALVWGTLIMAFTGLVLWFENISLQIFPLWFLDVSTVIHFYEAILATLAILVWHFYFVIFNPTVYPVNFSMFNGYITEEEMREEHAAELEEFLTKEPEQEPEQEILTTEK
ncbi:MAG: cytochrome b/b6 domain-containing protein [Deferribacteres bacterium]|nr:cytochrome b/b6 domain-containing protein [candidate division KSB1 bacterium]MCB9511708.1 cytochrome b/b6 domain-containing protein [Deferribacteres bacterium]